MGSEGSIRSGGKKACESAESVEHKGETIRRRQATAVQGGLRPQIPNSKPWLKLCLGVFMLTFNNAPFLKHPNHPEAPGRYPLANPWF